MQLKSLSLLAGAIALTLTATATPLAVQAQTPFSSRFEVAQAQRKGPWASLELTEEQKAKIRDIQSNARAQMEEVFTPEQKAKLEAARQERQARRAQRQPGQRPPVGERPGKKLADLNLTDEQKVQLRTIRENSKKQIEAVLTTEQRAKLEELKANRRSRWQQRQQQRQPQNNN